MKEPVFVLLPCIFIVMIGFGIVLPVLPFYAERLALIGWTARARRELADLEAAAWKRGA